jgi:HKD family nuclease
MNIDYIVQPDRQLGQVLIANLENGSSPTKLILVSAFMSLQTAIRLKPYCLGVKNEGGEVRINVGVDLRGTSKDVLEELLTWGIEVNVVKNGIPRHIFHPKVYLVERKEVADFFVGSNNFTEGGMFGNYECATHVSYDLKTDKEVFKEHCELNARFLNPEGSIVYPLTEQLIADLSAKKTVLSEKETRKIRTATSKLTGSTTKEKTDFDFGTEAIDPPPPLPADLLEGLVKNVAKARRSKKKDAGLFAVEDNELLPVAAFYMMLPKMQGKNIPGEPRVPLAAVELAQEFWGFPDKYVKDVTPRKGKTPRIYHNWYPIWDFYSTDDPSNNIRKKVRMYLYENSSDYRFYLKALVNAGADLGDIVRIKRIDQSYADYECVLAKKGTKEYDEWLKYCTQEVRNSDRRFGYA